MDDRFFIGKMIFMIGGLLVWAIHFTLIYGFTTVVCAEGFAATDVFGVGIVPFAIGSLTLFALASTGALLAMAISGPAPPRSTRYGATTEQFMQYTAVAIAALSLIAIAWNAVPALLIPPC